MADHAIRARFRVAYPDYALNIDLSLPGAGVTAIVGPSGAGKTTLLRVIAGLEKPDNALVQVGRLCWQDSSRYIFIPPYQRALGYVTQKTCLFPHLNVLRNLQYGQRRNPINGPTAHSLEQSIALLGIGHLLQRMPGTLSGGEAQRVGIARALATAPAILLLDEPLAAVDVARRQEILPYLEKLHTELAIPMLYVTHAMDEAARLADHLVWLEHGQVKAEGNITDMAVHPALPFNRATSTDGNAASAIILANINAQDDTYQLTRVEFGDNHLWLPQLAGAIGEPVRLRIQARDISLSLTPAIDSSILNSLPAIIEQIQDNQDGQMLIMLKVKQHRLLAHITRKSCHKLGLAVGNPVHAQIKGVAVLK